MFIHKADEDFDPAKCFKEVPLYQGLFFRRWQERYGRQVLTLVADDGERAVRAFAQCVEYVFPGVGSLWVASLGPLGSFSSDSGEEVFYKELQALCVELSPKTFAVRVQRQPEHDLAMRMVRAEQLGGSFVQPFIEEVVSLEESIEDIVSGFSKNTRRMVQRYERGEIAGIRFHVEKQDFKKYFEEAYELYEQLACAKKFSMHPRDYYEALFEELQAHPENGMLVLGYIDGEEKPAAFVLVIHTGREAYHLYSVASAAGYEHNMPTLAHYIAIRNAKKQGMIRYNLGGVVSTSPNSVGNLSVFKKKFGGKSVEHPSSVDFVVSVRRYALFRFLRLRWVFIVRRLLMRWYRTVQVELDKED